jgi:dolichyl-phosphate-mannose--protein O-mannosyl transferase
VGIAAIVAVAHVLTNGRYGFHRDELQVLSDARHLDWGFVPYPPLTPFVERISMSIFGLSLVGLRLFSVIAQAILVVVAGLMARELGGGRLAQVTLRSRWRSRRCRCSRGRSFNTRRSIICGGC